MDPRSLPIYQVESELLDALKRHRVVVVEGTTGSGKTTQIPRILLHGLEPRCIAVTQPRRVAAVSVAWRIAEEEGVELGREVGYGIRFDDVSSGDTRIKLMTDGLMLSEARTSPNLSRYDIVMVDEAHERSLNIDVTLGLLYGILQVREDLRVVVSSATLDPEQYQRYFRPIAGEVPLISVDSEVHPVQVHYAPPSSGRVLDLADHVAQLVAGIVRRGEPGHVLVFLSGEGAIRQVARTIDEVCSDRDLVVLPLFGRLTREEQEQVFDDFGKRKVILATNIAETSITVPDVRHVIDSGLAKIPRFRPRTGITQLREEPISLASLEQRKGRAGRTAPGVVWRLFEKSSLGMRPERTEEEILRLDLAEAVLRILDLGIRDIEDFPFPTAPPDGKIRAALDLLLALGAIDADHTLTRIGRRMTPFPLTPSLARMVIEAAERYESVVDDVLVVGAFMSGRSPMVLPEEDFHKARAAHARWHHPMGDACTQLDLYRAWEKSNFRESFCTRHFLDFEVMQFTRKAYGQLRDIARDQGIELKGGGDPTDVVKAVATGLPDKLLKREDQQYVTPSGARLSLHPGCSLIGDPPAFAVATELVAYARPYAINVSRMRAGWIAEISPSAARAFRIGTKKRSDAKPPPVSEVRLGGVTFMVDARQGKPAIEIPLEQLTAVRRASINELSPGARKLRGRVRWTEQHTFAATRLPKLLEMIRSAAFPKPGSKPPNDIRFGDMWDVNRGRHHIERALDRMLEPAVQGKSAGWVALIANGGGGYWLDVVFQWSEALATCDISLAELAGELYEGDDLLYRVERLQQEVEEQRRNVR